MPLIRKLRLYKFDVGEYKLQRKKKFFDFLWRDEFIDIMKEIRCHIDIIRRVMNDDTLKKDNEAESFIIDYCQKNGIKFEVSDLKYFPIREERIDVCAF